MLNHHPKITYFVLLLLLFLNDHHFKYNFPGIITGKLSDFTGIACLCMMIMSLTKNKRLVIALLATTSLCFIWWKSQYASFFITEWNKITRFNISRVVDPSDLIALIVIPILFYYSKYNYIAKTQLIRIPIILSSLFIFVSTAGTHGRLRQYDFDCSKNELRNSILDYFDEHEYTIVPDSLAQYTTYYKIESLDSDSVNFYFHLFYNNKKIIYWSKISGNTDNWDRAPTQLMLIGVRIGDHYALQTKDSLSYEDRRDLSLVFEREVIDELKKDIGSPDSTD